MLMTFLHRILREPDHKKLMLMGLMGATAVLFSLFAFIAFLMGHNDIFYLKMFLAMLLIVLLMVFRRSGNTPLYALLFLLVVEFESFSAMFGGHFYDFVTIFPFFAIFGFFYFFPLRTALWFTLIHYLFWIAFAVVLFNENADNPVFHHVPLLNMLSTTFVVIAIALLYYVSTELTYQKLEKSDRQKAVLIKEIHHRIKNNLNRISSILGLQIVSLRGNECERNAVEILEKNKLRIEAMAMVHDAIYRSDDLEHIDSKKYIANLVASICRAFDKSPPYLEEVQPIFLPLEKMMRVGIILNELCANTVKHGSDEHEERTGVSISFTAKEEKCTLRYTQDISKHPVDINTFSNGQGIGLSLVRLSVQEMDGKMDIVVHNDDLVFTVTFFC